MGKEAEKEQRINELAQIIMGQIDIGPGIHVAPSVPLTLAQAILDHGYLPGYAVVEPLVWEERKDISPDSFMQNAFVAKTQIGTYCFYQDIDIGKWIWYDIEGPTPSASMEEAKTASQNLHNKRVGSCLTTNIYNPAIKDQEVWPSFFLVNIMRHLNVDQILILRDCLNERVPQEKRLLSREVAMGFGEWIDNCGLLQGREQGHIIQKGLWRSCDEELYSIPAQTTTAALLEEYLKTPILLTIPDKFIFIAGKTDKGYRAEAEPHGSLLVAESRTKEDLMARCIEVVQNYVSHHTEPRQPVQIITEQHIEINYHE